MCVCLYAKVATLENLGVVRGRELLEEQKKINRLLILIVSKIKRGPLVHSSRESHMLLCVAFFVISLK